MGFLLFVFTLAGWAYLYNRLRNAEDRLNEEQYERSRNSEIIAELTRRVWASRNCRKRRRWSRPRRSSRRSPHHSLRFPPWSSRRLP